uniref:Uncharacterized protein n=1 Tax=Anopheles melas TaxID=34690 RepID=A0A182TJ91_9DIPT
MLCIFLTNTAKCLLLDGGVGISGTELRSRDEPKLKDIANTITNVNRWSSPCITDSLSLTAADHHNHHQPTSPRDENTIPPQYTNGTNGGVGGGGGGGGGGTGGGSTGGTGGTTASVGGGGTPLQMRPHSLTLPSSAPAIVSAIVKKIPTSLTGKGSTGCPVPPLGALHLPPPSTTTTTTT